jgi:hypothetical protein
MCVLPLPLPVNASHHRLHSSRNKRNLQPCLGKGREGKGRQAKASSLSRVLTSRASLHCGPPLLLLHFHPHARPAAGAKPSRRPRPSLLLGLAGAGRPNLDRKAEGSRPLPLFALSSDLAPDLLRPLLPTTILSIQHSPLETQLLPLRIRPPNSAPASAASPTLPAWIWEDRKESRCLTVPSVPSI